jgi:hypothetical protein
MVGHNYWQCENGALSGTHYAFNFKKYGDRYLAEMWYRFNRRFDLKG